MGSETPPKSPSTARSSRSGWLDLIKAIACFSPLWLPVILILGYLAKDVTAAQVRQMIAGGALFCLAAGVVYFIYRAGVADGRNQRRP